MNDTRGHRAADVDLADQALYEAKRLGRNRVVVFGHVSAA